MIVIRDGLFLPDPVISNIMEWRIIPYDRFNQCSYWKKLERFFQATNCKNLTFLLNLNLGNETSKLVKLIEPTFADYEKVLKAPLGEVSIELYLESGYLYFDEIGFIVYLEKYTEVAMIGIEDSGIRSLFDQEVGLSKKEDLVQQLNNLYNGPLCFTKNRLSFINRLVKNYFPNEEIVINKPDFS